MATHSRLMRKGIQKLLQNSQRKKNPDTSEFLHCLSIYYVYKRKEQAGSTGRTRRYEIDQI